MKKILLSIFAIVAIVISTQAQWIEQNSNLADSRGIDYMSAVDASVVWAAAYDGTTPANSCRDYTKTIDGGTTWVAGTVTTATGTTGLKFAMIEAVDANKAWAPMFRASGSKPMGIYATTDGGTTWAKQETAPFTNSASFPNCLHFWDANTGWCMGDPISGKFEMYTTTDGGTTWTAVPGANSPTPLSGEWGIVGYKSVVGDIVWFGTNLGRIYKSVDKGLNWTVASCTPFEGIYIKPFFKDETTGLIMDLDATSGSPGRLAKTSDGGATFTEVIQTGNVFNNDMAFIPGSESTWVRTGADAASGLAGVTYSFDDGETWIDMAATIGLQFLATDFIDDSTGWAGAFANSGAGGMYKFDGNLVAPVPDFEASDTAIVLGGQVTFTNLSSPGTTSFQWTFEGGIPATSTAENPPAITYNNSGAFNVTLKATNEWGDMTLVKTDYIYVGGTGINDLSQASVKVYPNPVVDQLNIESSVNIQEIRIINLVGQAVLIQNSDANIMTINTSDLKSGIYNLKLKMADGYINKKIVVN
ncbi:MAG: T9SS type A sorting domain-containing protein [bacterium]